MKLCFIGAVSWKSLSSSFSVDVRGVPDFRFRAVNHHGFAAAGDSELTLLQSPLSVMTYESKFMCSDFQSYGFALPRVELYLGELT